MAAQFKNWMGRGKSSILEVNDKTVTKLSKNAAKLVQISASPKIGLKNSPPFLPSIVAETQNLLGTIFEQNSVESLRDNMHLSIFVNSFHTQIVKSLKLFKDAREMMEDPTSDYRRVLNKLTLVFSHSLAELKAFWPEGIFKADLVIVKHDARDFWDNALQGRAIVPWEEFVAEFGKIHKFMNPNEPPALKRTIDLLENNHVSRFEFDIFTRLFQPWKQILNNWNVIVCYHPGYQAFMTYDEVEATLRRWQHKPGSFVFRLSCTRLGQWAIGFVANDGKIVQTIPHTKSLYQALIDGMEENVYIYPNGEDTNPDIRRQIRVAEEDHIKVSRDQFDLYCDIESAFETCKICDARLKSVRMEPCGHLLCKPCLTSWMDANGGRETLCPFCREKVLSTESVIVDPYQGDQDESESDEDVPPPVPGTSRPSMRGPALPPRSIGRIQRQHNEVPPITRPMASPGSVQPVAYPGSSQNSSADPDAVHRLMALGFPKEQVVKALNVAKNNIQIAANILCQFGSGADAFGAS